jgi:hypothetical protein
MFHVNVFDNTDTSERDFVFDTEYIADAFVRGLHSIDSLMITYHQSVTLPSGRTVYTELSCD